MAKAKVSKRKKPTLNKQKEQIINKEFLKEDISDEMKAILNDAKKIEVVKKMPKMVKVIFRNQRDPGVTLKFHYSNACEGIPLTHYTLVDGKEYILPQLVVNHLEERNLPRYHDVKGEEGTTTPQIKSRTYNFMFKYV